MEGAAQQPGVGVLHAVTGSFGQIAQRADFITASTEPLKHELVELDADAPRKTVVLRNCVNTEIWSSTFTAREPVANEPFVVGWFGSPTHQEELEIVEEAIRYLLRKYEGAVEFHFFGYLPKNLREIPGVKLGGAGVANVEKHAKRVREAPIHLAIAPLTDHPVQPEQVRPEVARVLDLRHSGHLLGRDAVPQLGHAWRRRFS